MKTHIKNVLAALAIFVFAAGLQAQSPLELATSFPPGTPFQTIADQVESMMANRDKGRGSGYKQWKRYEAWMLQHLDADGRTTNYVARDWAAAQAAETQERGLPLNGEWTSLGPTSFNNSGGWNPGLGRVNCVAFHPTNGSVYIGAAGGGLWRGTPDGSGQFFWTYLTKSIPVPSVSGIVVHPTNPNIIHILTGDGDGADSYSIGMLSSTDGGQSWRQSGLTWGEDESVSPFKLAMYPGKPDTMFAATSVGLFRTFDGGDNWVQMSDGYVYDFEFKPDNPRRMYMTTRGRSVVNGTVLFNARIAYNPNCLASPFVLNSFVQSSIGNYPANVASRIALEVSAARPSRVYAVIGQPNNSMNSGTFAGFYRSLDSCVNFTRLTNTPNLLGYNSNGQDARTQAAYDLALWVSDTDEDTVLVGGVNKWRSTDEGFNFSLNTFWNLSTAQQNGWNCTHADIHAFEFNPADGFLYCGNDGGIYRSNNGGTTWTNITPGALLTQFYDIDVNDANANFLLGAAQDNGVKQKRGAAASWQSDLGADGVNCWYEGNSTNVLYGITQDGTLYLATDGTTFNSVAGTADDGAFVTRTCRVPGVATDFYYRALNGVRHYTRTGSNVDYIYLAGPPSVWGDGSSDRIGAGDDRVYASRRDSLWRAPVGDGALTDWTLVSENAGSWTTANHITGIAVNPDNGNEIWVTLGGYDASQKVFRSTNGGQNWSNMTDNLPNTAVLCIAFDDQNNNPGGAVYVGTDIGVYYRDDDVDVWTIFSNGLPKGAAVVDLKIHESSGRVFAGTFGHGIWSSPVITACPPTLTVNIEQSGYNLHQASQSIQSAAKISGGFGTEVIMRAANFVDLKAGFQTVGNSFFQATNDPCQVGTPGN